MRKFLQGWQWLSRDWHIFLEPRISSEDLGQTLVKASIPAFGFYFLLVLSAILATLGLLANSTATIIGAMIIAPLMGPIMAIAYSLVTANSRLLHRASLTLITGIAFVIVISFLSTILLGSRVAGSEILARSNPNLLDLGVAITAGAAGAFVFTRRSIANALPGVAISVALVPPLCVTGIGLALGNRFSAGIGLSLGNGHLVTGSFLLFLTNLTGIVVSGSLVFLSQRYGRLRPALLGLGLPFMALLVLSYPLGFSLKRLLLQNRLYYNLTSLGQERPELLADVKGYSWTVEFCDSPYESCDYDLYVEIDLIAPSGFMDDEKFKKLQARITETVNASVDLKVRVIPIEVYGGSIQVP